MIQRSRKVRKSSSPDNMNGFCWRRSATFRTEKARRKWPRRSSVCSAKTIEGCQLRLVSLPRPHHFSLHELFIVGRPLLHQRRLEGYLFASNASTPNVLPALPITSARATAIGTSSSQIHAVPHSETHKVVRKRKAAKATGRVSNPISKRIPNEISVAPCIGPATL